MQSQQFSDSFEGPLLSSPVFSFPCAHYDESIQQKTELRTQPGNLETMMKDWNDSDGGCPTLALFFWKERNVHDLTNNPPYHSAYGWIARPSVYDGLTWRGKAPKPVLLPEFGHLGLISFCHWLRFTEPKKPAYSSWWQCYSSRRYCHHQLWARGSKMNDDDDNLCRVGLPGRWDWE